jgi:hypothetical protein
MTGSSRTRPTSTFARWCARRPTPGTARRPCSSRPQRMIAGCLGGALSSTWPPSGTQSLVQRRATLAATGAVHTGMLRGPRCCLWTWAPGATLRPRASARRPCAPPSCCACCPMRICGRRLDHVSAEDSSHVFQWRPPSRPPCQLWSTHAGRTCCSVPRTGTHPMKNRLAQCAQEKAPASAQTRQGHTATKNTQQFVLGLV